MRIDIYVVIYAYMYIMLSNYMQYSTPILYTYNQFYEKDGKTLPGKKGISLSLEQYKALRAVIKDGSLDAQIEDLEAEQTLPSLMTYMLYWIEIAEGVSFSGGCSYDTTKSYDIVVQQVWLGLDQFEGFVHNIYNKVHQGKLGLLLVQFR